MDSSSHEIRIIPLPKGSRPQHSLSFPVMPAPSNENSLRTNSRSVTVKPILLRPAFDKSKPHPFKMPHVLRQIMSFLPIKDLKSCRLTSQEFHTHATYFFRKKHPSVKLENSRSSGSFVKLVNGMKEIDANFPYQNFTLRNLLSDRIHIHFEDFGRFIRKLSLEVTAPRYQRGFLAIVINFHNALRLLSITPNVEDLSFAGVSFTQTETEEVPALPEVPLVLSRLKTLSIDSSFSNLAYAPTRFQENLINHYQVVTVINHLLSLGANNGCLEEIKLNINPLSTRIGEEIYKAFFKGIAKITSLKKLTIESTDMEDDWFLCLLNTSETPGPTLQELNVYLNMFNSFLTDWNWTPLYRLVQQHRDSLETLQLLIPEFGHNPNQLVLPQLKNLKTLHLLACPGNFYMNPKTPLAIWTGNGIQHLWSKLRTVSLPYSFIHSFFNAKFENPPLSSVEIMKLIIPPRLTFTDPVPDATPCFFKLFPNLKELGIETQDRGPMVLPLINKLFASIQNTDEIKIEILGIRVCGNLTGPSDSSSSINTVLLGKETPAWILQLYGECANQFPGNVYSGMIRNFQNIDECFLFKLKRLRQVIILAHESDPVDNLAAYFTLSFLKPLEKLVIRNSSITPYYCKMLKSMHKKVEFLGRTSPSFAGRMVV